MQSISNSIQIAHQLLLKKLKDGGLFVDATMGNGHDTAFIIEHCRPQSTIYAFDIQEEALVNTRELLDQQLRGAVEAKQLDLHLLLASHTKIKEYVQDPIDGAIFNLGYLPLGEKKLTTTVATSLKALEQVVKALALNGVCAVVLYPGHTEGVKEYEEIQAYVTTLPKKYFTVGWYKMVNHNHNAPALCWIEKVGDLNESNKTCKD